MALFQWNPTYSVEDPKIDAQHQGLFALVNMLHDAMLRGEANASMREILAKLADYTRVHFAEEERVMAAAGYPKLQEHKAKHDAFTQHVLDLQRSLAHGTPVSVKTLALVKDWLSNHVLNSDKQYVPYLQATPQ